MTDKEKLAKVKAEIERRKKEVEDNIFELGNFESERIGLFDNKEIYNDLLSFIDSMQEEPISEDLDKAIGEYCSNPDNFITYIDGWPKAQNADDIPLIEKAIRFGAQWQKEHLMANAVDAVVKVDAGGYPYVDRTIELYDYDKDIPLAKRGDKYKLILIKED